MVAVRRTPLWVSEVDGESAAMDLSALERIDGCARRSGGLEGDEAKPAATAFGIEGEMGARDPIDAVAHKGGFDLLGGCIVGKVAHIERTVGRRTCSVSVASCGTVAGGVSALRRSGLEGANRDDLAPYRAPVKRATGAFSVFNAAQGDKGKTARSPRRAVSGECQLRHLDPNFHEEVAQHLLRHAVG
jgi:hypothetical protein